MSSVYLDIIIDRFWSADVIKDGKYITANPHYSQKHNCKFSASLYCCLYGTQAHPVLPLTWIMQGKKRIHHMWNILNSSNIVCTIWLQHNCLDRWKCIQNLDGKWSPLCTSWSWFISCEVKILWNNYLMYNHIMTPILICSASCNSSRPELMKCVSNV